MPTLTNLGMLQVYAALWTLKSGTKAAANASVLGAKEETRVHVWIP